MNKKTVRYWGFALIMAVALITGAVPAVAQTGGSGGDMLLSTFESFDYDVAVAYNSNTQEFLAVWSHGGELYGQIYDGQGVPQGENLLIDGSGSAYRPAVAYSLAFDRYLIVSEHWILGESDIYGQLVDADGSLLGASFALDNRAGDQSQPNVASDGAGFFAVWHGDDGGGVLTAIYGRGVTGGGIISPAILLIAGGGGMTRKGPAVAFNEAAAEYLVVFRYDAAATTEIHGRRVAQNGSLPGNEYLITSQHYAYDPDLAATPWGATGGYVVVWSDFRDGDYNIYGRVVLAGADSSFDGGDFAIADAAGSQQTVPAIARSPASGQFLVVWQDDRSDAVGGTDIYGQRLTDDANLAGANFVVSAAYSGQFLPAVAATQAPDAYLVLWEDDRIMPYDIYGQRVASNGSLLWYEFAVSAQPEAQSAPAVAYDHDTDQYLAVWQDQRDGQWAIYGQRLSAEGWPLEEPWAIEADGHDNVQPAVDYSGAEHLFVVVWADENLDKLEGRQVPAAGQATVLFSVIDSDGGRHPALAYDNDSNHFLVAWDDGFDVYARALAGNGFPLGGPSTLLSPDPGWQQYPDIALNTDDHLFLVVWHDDLGAGAVDIHGRHVDQLGDLSGPDLFIAGGGSTPRRHPAVAYDRNTQHYLAVYECQVASKESDIYGQRLDSSGGTVGAELIIRDQPAGADQFGPDLFYVPEAGQYYVIWAEDQGAGAGYDLYGRWLDAAGGPASSFLPFFRYSGDQQYPRLAYDMDHGQGLVVWFDTRRGKGGDVYTRLGALDLEPPVALFTRDPTVGAAGTTFVFDARPSHDNLTPPGALRVRWDWTSNGSWDTPLSYDKVVSQTVLAPGVYTVTLEVWDLMWLTDTVSLPIRVLAASPNTPPSAELAVAPPIGVAGTTFQLDASACSDAETPAANLQVRWDWENDGLFDTLWSAVKIRDHAFNEAGLHMVRVEVRDAEGLTDAAVRPLLVLPGNAVTLAVSPEAATLAPHETLRFRATAWDVYDNRMNNPSVTWSVSDGAVGEIGASGLFTAGLAAGIHPDVIQATSGSASDTASVTIVYPYQIYLPLVERGF